MNTKKFLVLIKTIKIKIMYLIYQFIKIFKYFYFGVDDF